jgi:D-xylose transport system permease protein
MADEARDPLAAQGWRSGETGRLSRLVARLEIDTRLFGMVASLALIWVGFDILSHGLFITPRNLYNLTLQTASVAIMATGMVLVIVTRQIDLSVGSLLGLTAMVMGIVQVRWLPHLVGFGSASIWPITLLLGMALGALLGALQGLLIGYLGIPAFVVTLSGLLIWRGAAWWVTEGQTLSPLDERFDLIGGGVHGAIGAAASWAIGFLGAAGIAFLALKRRRRRVAFGFPIRPLWAEAAVAAAGCLALLAFVAAMNAYDMPALAARRFAEARGWALPPDGLHIAEGVPIPALILLGLGGILALLLHRTRFGRSVYAIGGNPEAASLAGIDTRRVIFWVFLLMGVLSAVSAAVASARLQSADNALGSADELRVIAAAVIGGTSLSGGVGTISGAVLGAVVIQSIQSGMALMGLDASLQNIVTGIVLVLAVYLDFLYRRRQP